MTFTIRPARHEDIASIVPWTTETFAWGDYVPDRLPVWLDATDSQVLVCVDDDDQPLALTHVTMLSPTEGWLEGARVHPDHRRSGMGSALNRAGVDWVASRGGRVMRLATEAGNEAARTQVTALGYREVSTWIYAELEVDPTHRAADQFRLRPAPGSDADAAWLFWAASDLARRGRELIAIGWQWRTARPGDVTRAGSVGELLQSPAGWVRVEQAAPDQLSTLWVATAPDDALVLLDGLLDLCAERLVTELDVKLPNLGWTSEAIRRMGGEPEELVVYSRPVG
jgi:GNAT superfamily N-acetyltransferase